MDHPLAHSTLGSRLIGTLDPTRTVARFRGIKYADIAQRWTRSTLATSYPDSVDARRFGPRCPQPEEPNSTADFGPFFPFEHDGSNDKECLNLNVTAPVEVDGPVPVFFWIHGGSLRFGAGSDPFWEPTVLVRECVERGCPIVVITINYRIGPFGFLTPSENAKGEAGEGNYGFNDQIVALEWVKRHIHGFGGDPRRVTIGGESAGGSYFRRAVMQSGNMAVMGFWDRRKMDRMWDGAVREMGLEGENALQVLQEAPWETIMGLKATQTSGYGVFEDNLFLSPPSFSPTGDLLPSKLATVDAVMHGDNAHEGNVFRAPAEEPNALQELVSVATEVLGERGKDELLSIYSLDEQLDGKGLVTRLHRFPEDARFYLPSNKVNEVWPNAAFYHLTATCPFASSPWHGESFHTFDLLYLFGCFDEFLEKERHEQHLALGRKIRSTWVDFIYGADPWEGAFSGTAATFTEMGAECGPVADARQWSEERKHRVERLHKLGFVKVVEVATRTFP